MRWYLAECMHSSIDRTPLRWSLCVSPCLYVCVPCCVSVFLCLILLPAAYDCAVESHARRSPTNIVIVDAGRDVRRTVANRHDVTTGHRAGLTTAVDSSRRLRSRLDRPAITWMLRISRATVAPRLDDSICRHPPPSPPRILVWTIRQHGNTCCSPSHKMNVCPTRLLHLTLGLFNHRCLRRDCCKFQSSN